jgi:chondroitin 4-sulfotransferase 11
MKVNGIIYIFIILWFVLVTSYLASRVSRKQSPILFIHIPKTGGMSIRKTKLFERCKYFGHKPITQIKNHKSDYKYSFAVTRNPYDRVVSAFHYLKNGGQQVTLDLRMQRKLEKYTSFQEFVKDLHLFIDDVHFKPQYTFVCDKDDRILVDYILENKTLDRDVVKLYKKEGVPVENTPKVNTSKHDDYSKYYDDVNTKKTVYQIYKKDFDLFNYKY